MFEREAGRYFPGLSSSTVTVGHDAGRRYRVTIPVPCYEPRRVQILFRKDSPKTPRVTVDGPVESKHRFPSGELCMWYPDDPVENRWVFEDDLIALLGQIARHLFREAWWRETGEWPGPEVEHSNISPAPTEQNGVRR